MYTNPADRSGGYFNFEMTPHVITGGSQHAYKPDLKLQLIRC